MKSGKAFFLFMILLVLCLLAFDWARNNYYKNMHDSPLIKAKTVFIILAGIAIMRLTVTKSGFKIFLIGYILLWMIYLALAMAEKHAYLHNISPRYLETIPLMTPLPFIFFWLVDRVFFSEKKLL